MKNGVPFDVAFSLSPDEATAWCIIVGELDGAEFCTATMRWKERK